METPWYQKVIQFIKEAIAELKKVTWLSRKEAVASTVVIIILIIIIAIFVGLADFILSLVMGSIL
ncbi:MAG TPA: preprotein translocase subunit SecE [Elusimicrobia bacterium]|nr:MAG: preprotein translocase subunit SecE [Elusimicrobia bacterium RIFOXYA12_FULL_49_49]OGS09819.1 MAG: preprotein translocase subunit SecE [Elusimicrobia bacterium RIFOXYB1_FULL_48_9]OGS09920.1 MAG: preprotein translocase subunit SecE [Elusimicrobia bacterium RIFOXYA1_FULL_47_7]OGS16344.1 MAG: preprotein translocase subunit SecE [Elusimicrobia bacterium RIFOXYA2_FULL_47_53]OGS27275.1 MAG: preprotein translocase subunit SecE [Elusimicrobia bacterium RIFOXYB12_FULL_50_12]OGS30478.1 MAG: prepr